jgi:hypothetical protein
MGLGEEADLAYTTNSSARQSRESRESSRDGGEAETLRKE